ncbi:hypothetical protein PR048_025424 [Dryococelus australis]|uniref:Uncharacterized protein n=1 Tax=Dryococelus australis TaxID=614101 RepID=A0ABQ9GR90_9NEOP|nr:hypothetical protein PR048_025424 [Dryococelus australis]
MPLVGEFSRGFLVFLALTFQRSSLIGFQDLDVKSRPNLFSHSPSLQTLAWPALGSDEKLRCLYRRNFEQSQAPWFPVWWRGFLQFLKETQLWAQVYESAIRREHALIRHLPEHSITHEAVTRTASCRNWALALPNSSKQESPLPARE